MDSPSTSTTRMKRIPRLPIRAVAVFADDDENDKQTFTAKGILREPENLVGFTYRFELHKSAVTIARIINILAEISHENIVQIYGMGDKFVVTSFWDETLLSRLLRMKEQQDLSTKRRSLASLTLFKRKISSSRVFFSHQQSSMPPLNLWQDVALPVTRALLRLHQHHVTLGGALDLTTIVLSGNGKMGPPRVYLRDFSRALKLSQDESDIDDLLAKDVYRLGMVFRELASVQPGPPGEDDATSSAISKLIESCCQVEAFLRPSIRRLHKRLLEILRNHHRPPAPGSNPSLQKSSSSSIATADSSQSRRSQIPRLKRVRTTSDSVTSATQEPLSCASETTPSYQPPDKLRLAPKGNQFHTKNLKPSVRTVSTSNSNSSPYQNDTDSLLSMSPFEYRRRAVPRLDEKQYALVVPRSPSVHEGYYIKRSSSQSVATASTANSSSYWTDTDSLFSLSPSPEYLRRASPHHEEEPYALVAPRFPTGLDARLALRS